MISFDNEFISAKISWRGGAGADLVNYTAKVSSEWTIPFYECGKNTENKTEVESVQLGNTYIADMDKCPQTNVLWTNVVVTVVICCICSQDPLFKV